MSEVIRYPCAGDSPAVRMMPAKPGERIGIARPCVTDKLLGTLALLFKIELKWRSGARSDCDWTRRFRAVGHVLVLSFCVCVRLPDRKGRNCVGDLRGRGRSPFRGHGRLRPSQPSNNAAAPTFQACSAAPWLRPWTVLPLLP